MPSDGPQEPAGAAIVLVDHFARSRAAARSFADRMPSIRARYAPRARMLSTMSDGNTIMATLAAREVAAERDSLAEHLRLRVQAFTIEAARI
jgi:hypothetical protein